MIKMINIRWINLFTFMMLVSFASAQSMEHKEMSDKYYAQKIAFITNALDLSPEESTVFWPLYNEYTDKKNDLHTEMVSYRQNLQEKYANISDEEAQKALNFYQEHMVQMQELEIAYQNKYLQVLPAKKVLLLLKAEKDFRRQLLKRLGRKRNNQ